MNKKMQSRVSSEDVAKIEREANPEPSRHNQGQPIRPTLDAGGNQRTKFLTNCGAEHAASLHCIEENYERRGVCQPMFEAYKKCRREEREKQLEENAKRRFF